MGSNVERIKVNGLGNKSAKIILVGEAPERMEEVERKPFVGGSGRILDVMLKQAGIIRDECYITYVAKIRPRDDNFKEFYQGSLPSPELLAYYEELYNEIKEIKPYVVIALGNESMKALTGNDKITLWRGSILWNEELNCKIVPTIHPKTVMHKFEFAPLVVFDLKKAKTESFFPAYTVPTPNLDVMETVEEVRRELQAMATAPMLSFDIETNGKNLTAVGFAVDPKRAISVVLDKLDIQGKVDAFYAIKELLESPIPKIAQNAQFDITFLATMGIGVKNLYLDTMCAHQCIYLELPMALSVLTSLYTPYGYYKHWVKEDLGRYNAMDALVTYICAQEILIELKETNNFDFYYAYVHPQIITLGEMQLRGVDVNLQVRSKARTETIEAIAKTEAELYKIAGYVFNVKSTKDVPQYLYGHLNLPKVFKHGTNRITADGDAIKRLQKKYPNRGLDLILKIRGLYKLLGTYLEVELDVDHRIRCSYKIGGTETGRLSSSKSLFGTGTNLQNIPHGVCRRMIIPDSGKVFIDADLSQAEARIVAYLSNDVNLIKAFTSGVDVHKKIASMLFAVPFEDVSSNQREKAKRCVHGLNYGMGVNVFAKTSDLGTLEAKVLRNAYFELFSGILTWQKEIVRELGRTRTLITPLGRKRYFYGRWSEQLFKEAYAYLPQSTIGDLLNLIMVRLNRMFKYLHLDSQIMLQVHDNVVIQCLPKDVDKVVSLCKQVNTTTFGKLGIIPMGFEVGHNWEDLSPWKEGQVWEKE